MTEKRMVKCLKLGRELPGLEKPPFPGELGQKIYEGVSQEAWMMWKDDMQIKVLNEYRLNMGNTRTDIELVEALKNNELAAFEELLNRYSEKVFHLAMRITRLQEDAEDVLQEAFLNVFAKIGEFRGTSAFSSWLYRITVNTAFMKLRKRRKHTAGELDDTVAASQECWAGKRSDTSDTNFLTARHELRAVLEEALDKLPLDYRTIFVLRDVDGLSNQQVSEIMQLSVPAIKSRLHRSRLLLRKRLRGYYDDYKSGNAIAYGPRVRSLPEYQLAA